MTTQSAGRHDGAAWRQTKRSGRERVCWAYIAAAELERAGVPLDAPAPSYRVWAGQRGRFVVTLKTAIPAGDRNA